MKKYADIPKENSEVVEPADDDQPKLSNVKPHKGFDGVGSWWGTPVHDLSNPDK